MPSSSGGTRSRGRPELVVFGRRAVLEALRTDSVEVNSVLAARSLPKSFRAELQQSCRAHEHNRELKPEFIHARVVSKLSGQPRHDQGIAARIRLLRVAPLQSLIDDARGKGAKTPLRVLALDGITNPQNIGMIVRSAVAAGIDALIWPTVGSPWIDGLVVKASASVVYRCPIVVCDTLSSALDRLHPAGFTSYGLAGSADINLYDLKPAHRSIFVAGRETTGITPEVDERLNQRIRIPMQGGVQSLNVAVAASLLCFELTRAKMR